MANQIPTEIQEQIVREAEDIEERKIGLLDSSKALSDAAQQRALYGEYLTPDYDVAGLSGDQRAAIGMGREGIGAYQPYMTAATQDVTTGGNTLGEAADVLRASDTRGQFLGAQAALNQSAVPLGQMGQAAAATTMGIPLIGAGAQGLTAAMGMANQYRQADLAGSQAYLNNSVSAMNQAMPNYGLAQSYVNSGAVNANDAAIRAQMAADMAGVTSAQGINSLQLGADQGKTAVNQGGFTTAAGSFNDAMAAARLGAPSNFTNEQSIFNQGLGTSASASDRAERATQQAGFDRGVNALYGGAQQGQAATQQGGFDQGIGQAYLAAEQARLAAAQPGFDQASSTLQQGLGALGGGAQRYDPSSAQGFMNPFQQQVIDESLRQINRQGDISRQNLQAQATRAGAFGGSREGVQRAELERAISEQRNAAITGTLASGYGSAQQQAQQAFEQQQQRQLAQAQGYQGAAGTQASIAGQRAGLGQSAAQQLAQAAQLETGTAGTRANLGLQAAGLQQSAGQGDINAANMQGGLGMQAAAQKQQEAQFQASTAQQLANLKSTQQQQALAQAQAMSGIGSQQGQMAGQQASLGLQAAGLTQNVGQGQLSSAGTQGQLGLSAAQQRAAAGQANLQAGSQTAAMDTQAAQLGQSAAQYMGNVGQNLGQQQLEQAKIGQAAANTFGNLSNQVAGLSGLYSNIYGQQANIYGQQSQLGQSLGQGIGNLANQQFGIGQNMAQGLGSLGSQQANLGMQKAALGQNAQSLGQQDSNFLFNLGSVQQKQAQAELDAERQNTLQKNMQPYQQLAFQSDIYKGAPSSSMSSMQQASAAPSPFQQAAGLGIAGLSAASAGSRAGVI